MGNLRGPCLHRRRGRTKMNHIQGKLVIGAPHSLARYQNAHRICADCVEKAPQDFSCEVLGLPGLAFLNVGQCYVCEQKTLVVAIRVDSRTH